MLFYEVFDVWGIDFTGPFLVSFGFTYILLDYDYVSKWMEIKATRTNDAWVVVDFAMSHIFCRFGIPKAIITDQGTHGDFALEVWECAQNIYTISPQTNGHVEISNREIKQIWEKIVQPNQKEWSNKLEDALWAHRTAYKAPVGMSPYWVIFGKSCHLLVESTEPTTL